MIAALCPALAFAQAQTPPAEDPASREEARLHFQQGLAHIEEARWREALVELEAARRLRSTPAVLYNIGVVYRAVGRYGEAITAFREYLAAPGTESEPTVRTQAAEYIREMEASIGVLDLDLEPANAAVSIDDEPAEAGQRRFQLNPGTHTVSAELDGYFPIRRRIEVRSGGTASLQLRLGAVDSTARVIIEANVPEAIIRLDGNSVGTGSADEHVRVGAHVIEITAPGRSTFTRNLEAIAGRTHRIRANLTDERPIYETEAFWIVTAVVVAALAAGGIALGFFLSGPQDPYQGSLGVIPDALVIGVRP